MTSLTYAEWRQHISAESSKRRRVQDPERLRDLVHVDSWRRERFLAATQAPRFLALRQRRAVPWSAHTLSEVPEPGRFAPVRTAATGPRWHARLADAKPHAKFVYVGTDPLRDQGALEDLRACEFARLHRVRDGGVLDEDMVLESFLYGADSIVLEAALLEDAQLAHLRAFVRELGAAVHVVVRQAADAARAVAVEPEAILVDARHPFTGQVDATLHTQVLPSLPKTVIALAAGGLDTSAQQAGIWALGARGLVLGDEPAAAVDWSASALHP
ncbi:MAG: indole-3-glycerol phosphate synthase [Planctomycetota bacterium]|jgi:indole-3-glycerol phosphate synthase